MRKALKAEVFSLEDERREAYKNNRRLYYRDCLAIKDRLGAGIIPFIPYAGQSALEKLRDRAEGFYEEISRYISETTGTEPRRRRIEIQVLKARRGGFSTDIAGQMNHLCEFHKSENGLVVAHREKNAQNIAEINRRFIEQFPQDLKEIKIPMKKIGSEITWGAGWDSRIIVETCKAKDFGRGFDYSFVHLSECAHYENPDAIAAAKDAAQFAKVIYEESTANGMDPFFFRSWEQALYLHEVKDFWNEHHRLPDKWNGKLKFFWAWWQDQDYRIALSNEQIDFIMNDLSDAEQAGVDRFGWDAGQIEWRRRKIASDCSDQTEMDPEDYFRQEYPSEPDEAFVSSGNAVFPQTILAASQKSFTHRRTKFHGFVKGFDSSGAILQKARKDDPNSSDLVIWEEPKEQHQYIIGAKPSNHPTHHGCCVVFDRMNGRLLKEVASYRGTMTSLELADLCVWLGFKYHGAFIIPEATVQSMAMRIAHRKYPYLYQRRNEEKLGVKEIAKESFAPGMKASKTWRSNRESIIHESQDALRKKELEIKSLWLLDQHMGFQNIEGAMQSPNAGDENGVISVALAVHANRHASPRIIVPDDLRPKESTVDKKLTIQEKQIMEAVARKKKKSDRRNKKILKMKQRKAKIRMKDLF